MKRSKSITLISMASLALVGCGEQPKEDGAFFASVDECKAVYSNDELCNDIFEESRRIHESSAPRFSSQKECEDQWGIGKCDIKETAPVNPPSSGTTSNHPHFIYIPQYLGSYVSPSGSGYSVHPFYSGANGTKTFVSGSGTPAKAPTSVSSTVVGRGGFGSTARSISVSSSGG